MKSYTNFIGIDIGKFTFVVAKYGDKQTKEYENNAESIELFLMDYEKILSESLCVLEVTGGYEMRLLLTLCERKISVHRANTRKVKNFIRSYGNGAKTDALDAKALALYAFERAQRLDCFCPSSEKMMMLYELIQRRQDLKQLMVAEKNRSKAPRTSVILESCHTMIKIIQEQIEHITKKLDELIDQDEMLAQKKGVLMSIPGVGKITAYELMILMPELGKINRRQAASLAGLAPRANDSGLSKGYRAIAHGRSGIKSILFMAAMAARNSKSRLKDFYEKLICHGKKKMVALTALMRKIIVIANAKLRDFENKVQAPHGNNQL